MDRVGAIIVTDNQSDCTLYGAYSMIVSTYKDVNIQQIAIKPPICAFALDTLPGNILVEPYKIYSLL
ncbi:hypothetical protein CQ062_19700 [Ochrobactrum sp. MYb68]|nr:hypothetical protein CQ062_19700 [Ochrobactrum sp. MYb68]